MSWMGERGRKLFTETAKHSLVPEADPKVNEESQWVVRPVISPLKPEHDGRRCHSQSLYDNRHHLGTSCPAPIPWSRTAEVTKCCSKRLGDVSYPPAHRCPDFVSWPMEAIPKAGASLLVLPSMQVTLASPASCWWQLAWRLLLRRQLCCCIGKLTIWTWQFRAPLSLPLLATREVSYVV